MTEVNGKIKTISATAGVRFDYYTHIKRGMTEHEAMKQVWKETISRGLVTKEELYEALEYLTNNYDLSLEDEQSLLRVIESKVDTIERYRYFEQLFRQASHKSRSGKNTMIYTYIEEE